MKVVSVELDTLTPFPGNPRRGDVAVIKESLSTHGQYQPLVAQESTRTILVGNHRWHAARDLGWKKVDVVFMDVDDDAARRIVAIDNASSDRATYDFAELEALLTSLEGDLEGTGYSLTDLDEINRRALDAIDDLSDSDEDDDDDQSGRSALLDNADLVEKEPEHKTKHGDVWSLSGHILVVGWPHSDWPVWVKYLEDPERDVPLFYPDIFVTASDIAKQEGKRLILVQPRPLLAGYMLDSHAAMYGLNSVEMV